jgi:ParB family chromosome partitioning protein
LSPSPSYEQAGGGVRRDLFCEDDSGIFILDTGLLDRLVAEKLEAEAASVRAEGWKWVAVRASFDYAEWSGFQRLREEPMPLSPEAKAELDLLTVEYDNLCDVEGDFDEETLARLSAIEQRMSELDTGATFWPAETLAMAGAIVALDDDGELDIRRAYVTPEDAVAASDESEDDASADDEPVALYVASLPASLTESLTTHRTAALGAALSQQPKVALAAMVHALALSRFYGGRSDSCLEISARAVSLKQAEGSKARELLENGAETWGNYLPGDSAQLWTWCLERSQDRLLDLLAFCAAGAVNAVQAKADRPDSDRFLHAEALADALALDMNEWFTPTAGNFFSRLTKDGIVEALKEARGGATAPAWLKAKKADLAAIAEREIAQTGWLPAPLRKAA